MIPFLIDGQLVKLVSASEQNWKGKGEVSKVRWKELEVIVNQMEDFFLMFLFEGNHKPWMLPQEIQNCYYKNSENNHFALLNK